MCKVTDAVCNLNPSECESLRSIGASSSRGCVPTGDAERLMHLGLIEVSCGGLEATPFGRCVLRKARIDTGRLIAMSQPAEKRS